MEKFVVKRVCEYLDQLRQELSGLSEPVVRMPDGTGVPVSVYVDQQLRQESSRLNSQWDQTRSTNFYSIKTEHKIQIGSFNCRADVVLLKLPFFQTQPDRLIVIVECKAVGKIGNGIEQLQSYLCATDTRLGIVAASLCPDEWKYYENHGRNHIVSISQESFKAQVGSQESTEIKKEKEVKRQIEQAIEYRSQRIEKQLVEQYKGKKIELQADLEKEKVNLQMRIDAAHKSGFWGGFKVGFWLCVIAVVVIAIIASGG